MAQEWPEDDLRNSSAADEERRLLRLMERAVESGDLPLAREYADRARAVRETGNDGRG